MHLITGVYSWSSDRLMNHLLLRSLDGAFPCRCVLLTGNKITYCWRYVLMADSNIPSHQRYLLVTDSYFHFIYILVTIHSLDGTSSWRQLNPHDGKFYERLTPRLRDRSRKYVIINKTIRFLFEMNKNSLDGSPHDGSLFYVLLTVCPHDSY